jgi:signal transduction histidine kinase
MGEIKQPSAGNQALGQELVKAKQIINGFIYSCSHSLRGPLKSISGLVHLLQQGPASEEDPREYMKLILQSVGKMECLLQQLEEALENSKKELIIEPVDLNRMVGDVLNQVENESGFHRIKLTVNVDQSVYFYSDATRLQTVLLNLVSNAITFHDTLKDTPFIDIFIKATAASCTLQVIDNGIGMATEVQDRIFELFYRGSDRSTGSGVGLYVAKEVLKKMGGSISVNSEVSHGSNFFVWVPNLAASGSTSV